MSEGGHIDPVALAEFDGLCMDLYDDTLDAAGAERLAQLLHSSPWLRRRFHEQALHAAQLAEECGEVPVRSRRSGRGTLRLPPLIAVAAAAVLVAAITLGLLTATTGGASGNQPLVREISGVATYERPGGGAVAVVAGLQMGAGGRLLLAERASLSLAWPDERTELVLAGDSVLDITAAAGGKRVHLVRGSLRAEVARQPAGSHFVATTPHAESTVVGTRFSLSADGRLSRLEVDEGLVSFAHGDRRVEIGAGFFAIASPSPELQPHVLRALPSSADHCAEVELLASGTGVGSLRVINSGIFTEISEVSLALRAQPAQQDAPAGVPLRNTTLTWRCDLPPAGQLDRIVSLEGYRGEDGAASPMLRVAVVFSDGRRAEGIMTEVAGEEAGRMRFVWRADGSQAVGR